MAELNHDAAQSLIQAAADGDLSLADRAALDAHLAGCAECRRYQAELARLQIAVAQALRARWSGPGGKGAGLPPDFARQAQRSLRRGRWLQALNSFTQAASLVVVVALFVNLIRLRDFSGSVVPPHTQTNARPAQVVAGAPGLQQIPKFELEAEPGPALPKPVALEGVPDKEFDPAQVWVVAGKLMAR